MSALEALLAEGARHKPQGCRYPGCGAPTRAAVSVMVRRFAENGRRSAGSYDASRSRQVSLCEEHAAEVWAKLAAELPS